MKKDKKIDIDLIILIIISVIFPAVSAITYCFSKPEDGKPIALMCFIAIFFAWGIYFSENHRAKKEENRKAQINEKDTKHYYQCLLIEEIMRQMKINNPEEAFRRISSGEWAVSRMFSPSRLLKIINTVTVPPATKKFVAKEHFIVDTSSQAAVKITYLTDRFRREFLNIEEEPFIGSTLYFGRLNKNSPNQPIIDELGGEKKAETTLLELWNLMAKQPNGKEGALLVNGSVNIFYIRNKAGMLLSVFARWDDDGWYMYAGSVEDPCEWLAESQVSFRDS